MSSIYNSYTYFFTDVLKTKITYDPYIIVDVILKYDKLNHRKFQFNTTINEQHFNM